MIIIVNGHETERFAPFSLLPSSANRSIFTCPERFGYFPDKHDCTKYFVCVFGEPLHESCTGGLYFSAELQTCDWPRNVLCRDNELDGEKSVFSTIDEEVDDDDSGYYERKNITLFDKKNLYYNFTQKNNNDLGNGNDEETSSIDELNKRKILSNSRQTRSDQEGKIDLEDVMRDITNLNRGKLDLVRKHGEQEPEMEIISKRRGTNSESFEQNHSTTSTNPFVFYTYGKDESFTPKPNVKFDNNILYKNPPFNLRQLNNRNAEIITVSDYKKTPSYNSDHNEKFELIGSEEAKSKKIDNRHANKINLEYDPQAPNYAEAIPSLVDSKGGIHFSDGVGGTYGIVDQIPGVVSDINLKSNLRGGYEYIPVINSNGNPFEEYEEREKENNYTRTPDDEILLVPFDGRRRRGRVRIVPKVIPKFKLKERQSFFDGPISGYVSDSRLINRKETHELSRDVRYIGKKNSLPGIFRNSDIRSEDAFGNNHLNSQVGKIEEDLTSETTPISSEYQQDNAFTGKIIRTFKPQIIYSQPIRIEDRPIKESDWSENKFDRQFEKERINTYSDFEKESITTTTTTTTTAMPLKKNSNRKSRPTNKRLVVKHRTTSTPNFPSRPTPLHPTPKAGSNALKCDIKKCRLPDCNCGKPTIPGNLQKNQVPQIILLTFDDAVNDLNWEIYEEIFNSGRLNPNGCPLLGTYYVSHEWTDYGQVQTLYSRGHEMASHGVTHSFGEKFSKSQWHKEINGQREILHLYGGVKLEDVRGMRAPFLQIGGNKMFEMLYDANFTYDSSMPVFDNKPPFWPYTLDYTINHECMITPCPTKSFPGLWEVGMVMWEDLRGGRCSMGDACSNPIDEDGVYQMLMKNFNRHYLTNRAPFGLFYHSAWFNTLHHRRGFLRFIDEILSYKDVFFTTNWQMIQWMRSPTPLSEINNFEPWKCNKKSDKIPCNNPNVCNVRYQNGSRFMKTCQPCPNNYPWLGNTGFGKSN